MDDRLDASGVDAVDGEIEVPAELEAEYRDRSRRNPDYERTFAGRRGDGRGGRTGQMKWHKVKNVLEKSERDVEIELTALGEGERNQYNEDREALQSELELLKTLARTIDEWLLERSRRVLERMMEARGR